VSASHTLYVLLGANLGDPKVMFELACQQLAGQVGPIERASALYETTAWGITSQPTYLNQVLRLGTLLSPADVLARTQAIETTLGRVRHERWGARLIDIDLLFYDDLVLQTPTLALPHPLLHERRFTLVPLAEIAPDLVHPVLKQSVSTLVLQCQDEGQVNRILHL
jgi:2-amino-4-hydroxy-6-hydroxymethyldihydropteridine diphosphokinase